MKLYENFINDGTLTNFYGGKTDSGYKLQINGEEKMKEKELTAVEWLVEELSMAGYFHYGPPMNLVKKAKEMEKKQIALAHGIKDTGVNNMKCVTGEQYYNETFKQQEQ